MHMTLDVLQGHVAVVQSCEEEQELMDLFTNLEPPVFKFLSIDFDMET